MEAIVPSGGVRQATPNSCVTGRAKSFVLITPSDSPLRFGPSSFRPTILLEDKYVAFGVSSEAVRAARDSRAPQGLEAVCQPRESL